MPRSPERRRTFDALHEHYIERVNEAIELDREALARAHADAYSAGVLRITADERSRRLTATGQASTARVVALHGGAPAGVGILRHRPPRRLDVDDVGDDRQMRADPAGGQDGRAHR